MKHRVKSILAATATAAMVLLSAAPVMAEPLILNPKNQFSKANEATDPGSAVYEKTGEYTYDLTGTDRAEDFPVDDHMTITYDSASGKYNVYAFFYRLWEFGGTAVLDEGNPNKLILTESGGNDPTIVYLEFTENTCTWTYVDGNIPNIYHSIKGTSEEFVRSGAAMGGSDEGDPGEGDIGEGDAGDEGTATMPEAERKPFYEEAVDSTDPVRYEENDLFIKAFDGIDKPWAYADIYFINEDRSKIHYASAMDDKGNYTFYDADHWGDDVFELFVGDQTTGWLMDCREGKPPHNESLPFDPDAVEAGIYSYACVMPENLVEAGCFADLYNDSGEITLTGEGDTIMPFYIMRSQMIFYDGDEIIGYGKPVEQNYSSELGNSAWRTRSIYPNGIHDGYSVVCLTGDIWQTETPTVDFLSARVYEEIPYGKDGRIAVDGYVGQEWNSNISEESEEPIKAENRVFDFTVKKKKSKKKWKAVKSPIELVLPGTEAPAAIEEPVEEVPEDGTPEGTEPADGTDEPAATDIGSPSEDTPNGTGEAVEESKKDPIPPYVPAIIVASVLAAGGVGLIYAGASVSAAKAAGSSVPIILPWKRKNKVMGYVTLRDGKPGLGLQVRLTGVREHRTTTDEEGKFEFNRLSETKVVLDVFNLDGSTMVSCEVSSDLHGENLVVLKSEGIHIHMEKVGKESILFIAEI